MNSISFSNMKNRKFFLHPVVWSVFATILLFSSCRSHKDLMILRGADRLDLVTTNQPTYRIKPKDNLFVSIVTSNKELNEIYNPAQSGIPTAGASQVFDQLSGQFLYGYTVDDEGSIHLPMIGDVRVGGQTVHDSEEIVKIRAEEYLKDVIVKVRLMNFKVTVIGEVNNPGVLFNYNSEYTIFDAISDAGGFTNYADLNEIKVIRSTPQGDKVFVVDAQEKSILSSEVFYMNPNDIINISPARNKNQQLRTQAATIALAVTSTAALIVNIILTNR